MIVPVNDLSENALNKIVEEFVLREGTEYGSHEVSLKSKVEQVVKQLRKGEAVLVFDSKTETLDIVSPRRAAEMGTGCS